MRALVFFFAILSCGVTPAGWVVKDGIVKNPVFKQVTVKVERKKIKVIPQPEPDEIKRLVR